MSKIDKMIEWFREKKSQDIGYSMINRQGPNYYDCSSSMYFSIVYAFGLTHSGNRNDIRNTANLPEFLEKNGFEKIADNCPWEAKKGDVIIWSRYRGVPGSEAHTALFTSSDTIIHCNYNAKGISEDSENSKMYLYKWNYAVYRYVERNGDEEFMNTIQERYMIHGDYSIDTLPWFCSDRKQVKTSTEYNGFVITVTRKWGAYYYSHFLGGWIDERALIPVTTIEKEVTIKHGGYSVDTKPWGTDGFETIMKTDELLNKKFRVTAQRGGYYYVHNIAKWIDMRAFE